MGQFDQTGRQMAKLEGKEFPPWALSCCDDPPSLSFLRWDDTRRLADAGEPDRVNDVVAEVGDGSRPALPCWLVVEIEDEAEDRTFLRTGQYELALIRELAPTKPRSVGVLSLILNLSGRQGKAEYQQSFGGYGMRLGPLVVDVSAQDASATLARIEKSELGLTVLPFCALMGGAGDPAFIEGWKSAVMRERDEGRRLQYRDWALVMTELTGWQPGWKKATEGWMERESVMIEGWKSEGREEGELLTMRRALCDALQTRLRVAVPEALRHAIEGSNDLKKLHEWFLAALVASDLADFRTRMNL
ncbi:MAG: hypothetical protein K2W96_05210 [Gemmataceae bacterium]|nr:hypothetical protein [Gemmataceae bacterium]